MTGTNAMERRAAIDWQRLGRLLVAVLAIQALYWFIIDNRLFRAEPSNEIAALQPERFEIARLSAPTIDALAAADFEAVDSGAFTHCCDTAAFAARMTYRLDKVPGAGLGVISTLQVDNYLLLANGSLVVGEGRLMPGSQTFHGQKTFLTRIPAGLLREGENSLTYITVRDGFPYTDIYPPILAEHDSLDRFAARRLWVMNDFPQLSGLVLALLGLMAAIMTARSEERRFAGWLSLLCGAFAANALYGLLLAPPFDGWVRMLLFFAVNLGVSAALLGFVDAWTGRPWRWLQIGAPLGWTAAMVATAAVLFRGTMPSAYDVPATIWSLGHLVFASLALGRLLIHFAVANDRRFVEAAILSVLVAAAFIDGLSYFFPDQRWMEGNLLHAAPFLMLAMILAFLARNVRLFRSQEAITDLLRARVAEREAELAIAHARESELVRAAAHDDERRRIMRDLHDGLGSQLMSMLLAARSGALPPSSAAEGLQTVIDELRLIVDSMDSVGNALLPALLTFRQRLEPRLAAANIALDWRQDIDGESGKGFGPRDVLQIFRVLQEAVGNALRHSGADRISVTVTGGETPRAPISIGVADNGAGIPIAATEGRGFGNMRARAAAIGGQLDIVPNPEGGTVVTLLLPGTGS